MGKLIELLIVAALVLGLVIGWTLNIVAIVNMDSVFSGMGVVRVIGIFIAPLGAVLGYI